MTDFKIKKFDSKQKQKSDSLYSAAVRRYESQDINSKNYGTTVKATTPEQTMQREDSLRERKSNKSKRIIKYVNIGAKLN